MDKSLFYIYLLKLLRRLKSPVLLNKKNTENTINHMLRRKYTIIVIVNNKTLKLSTRLYVGFVTRIN